MLPFTPPARSVDSGGNRGFRDDGPGQPAREAAQSQETPHRFAARSSSLAVARKRCIAECFPVAVGMPNWETPLGEFEVMQKIDQPIWVHPVTGERVAEQGPDNPLAAIGSPSIAIVLAAMPTMKIADHDQGLHHHRFPWHSHR